MNFTKLIGRILGRKEEKVLTQKDLEDQMRRNYAARMTMLKISDRMKARPDRMKAEARRRMRAARRACVNRHVHQGSTMEEGDKPAFYSHGVLFKDGNGEYVLEVL